MLIGRKIDKIIESTCLPSEKLIIIALLLHGRLTAGDISAYTKISMRATYYALEKLKNKRVITRNTSEYQLNDNYLQNICRKCKKVDNRDVNKDNQ